MLRMWCAGKNSLFLLIWLCLQGFSIVKVPLPLWLSSPSSETLREVCSQQSFPLLCLTGPHHPCPNHYEGLLITVVAITIFDLPSLFHILAGILQRCFMEDKNAQVLLYKRAIRENQVAPGDSGLFWGRDKTAVNTGAGGLLCNKTLLCGWSGSKGFSVKNVGVYHVLCVRTMMRYWQRI